MEKKMISLPIHKDAKKKLVQAEVEQDLYEAVQKEAKSRHIKIRQIVEWGFKSYLMSVAPKLAGKFAKEE